MKMSWKSINYEALKFRFCIPCSHRAVISKLQKEISSWQRRALSQGFTGSDKARHTCTHTNTFKIKPQCLWMIQSGHDWAIGKEDLEKPQLGAGAVRIAFWVGRLTLFTMGHKWRRGESKEVGPDATDWLQSSWVIGRQDDGGSCSRLTHHCSNSYGFIYLSRGHLVGRVEWADV